MTWDHGPSVKSVSNENGYAANKIMANVSAPPLPDIGPPSWEIWQELSDIRVDVTPFIEDREQAPIRDRLQAIERPLILFHPKGNTLKHAKNLNDEEIDQICHELGRSSAGTLLILDWDNRVSIPKHPRIHTIGPYFGKSLRLPELITLLDCADLLIGIDSGPAHLSRMVPHLRTLYLWHKHHPFAFSFPRQGDLHLVPNALRQQTPDSILSGFSVANFDESRPPVEKIVSLAQEMVGLERSRNPRLSVSGPQSPTEQTLPFPNSMESSTPAVYSYCSDNIGDDMQSLVLRRWLGYREDEILYFDRDRHHFVGDRQPDSNSVQLLVNAFIGEGALPIPQNEAFEIQPIFLAIHMASVAHDNPEKLDQLRKFAPVGCRDKQALRECEQHDVPAYYAGCPTILCEPADIPHDIDILLVDIDPRKLPALPERRVIRYSSNMNVRQDTPVAVRREMCLRRWELLSRSRLVVTSKLHAAMPALGMGRPVVFIKQGIVCSGRLSAFPEDFPTYEVGSRFSWDPSDHDFDITEHRKLVESKLLERIGHLRKTVPEREVL